MGVLAFQKSEAEATPFLGSLALKPTHGRHILLVHTSHKPVQMQGGGETDPPSEGLGLYYKGTDTPGGEEVVASDNSLD